MGTLSSELFNATSLGPAPKGRKRVQVAKQILEEERVQVLDRIADECRIAIVALEHVALQAEWAKDKPGTSPFNELGALQGNDRVHIYALVGRVHAITNVMDLIDVVLEPPSDKKGDK